MATSSITYELCDPAGLCDQATVSFTVTAVNDVPVANDDNGADLTEDGANGSVNILTMIPIWTVIPTLRRTVPGSSRWISMPEQQGVQTSLTNLAGNLDL